MRARPHAPHAGLTALTVGLALAGAAISAGSARSEALSARGDRSFSVGIRVLRYVDHTRFITLPDGRRQPRTLITYIRYPAAGPGSGDRLNAPAARHAGPFPLVVFAHGFDATPGLYDRLLRAWARAGYVVAAPVFPQENANAPGGPDAADQNNEPTDMSVVITHLLAATRARSGPFAGLIDPRQIAVAGQSDGAEAALAVAYSRDFHDSRVRAAIVMSGAESSGVGGFHFGAHAPALLAIQGTADTSNEPRYTYEYFDAAHRPKYLLKLPGAGHLPPYTEQQPQLSIVTAAGIDFLDAYLKHAPGALRRLYAAIHRPGYAELSADP